MHQFHQVEDVDSKLHGHQVGSGAGGAAAALDSKLRGHQVGSGAGSAAVAPAAGVAEAAPPPAARSLQLLLLLLLLLPSAVAAAPSPPGKSGERAGRFEAGANQKSVVE
jgi:hypothetical protein